MITRIVKMTFQASEREAFLQLFETVKHKIRNCEGCRGLSLLEDISDPCVMFTYSHWDSEADLNRYRKSELFAGTWKDTKSKFSAPALAWSVRVSSKTEDNNTPS